MEMNFAESPVVYIVEYYRDKIFQIDLKCEKEIFLSEDDTDKSDLKILRMDIIKHIENARKEVLARYYLLESKFYQDMSQSKIDELRDDIFQDKYCLILDVFEYYGLFEFKFGVLIFTQYDDFKLSDLKFFKFFYIFNFIFS